MKSSIEEQLFINGGERTPCAFHLQVFVNFLWWIMLKSFHLRRSSLNESLFSLESTLFSCLLTILTFNKGLQFFLSITQTSITILFIYSFVLDCKWRWKNQNRIKKSNKNQKIKKSIKKSLKNQKNKEKEKKSRGRTCL